MYYGYRPQGPWVEYGKNLHRNTVTGQLFNAKLKRYAKRDPKTGKSIMQDGRGGWVPIDWSLFSVSSPGVCLLGVCSSEASLPIPPPPPRPTTPTA